MHTICHYCTAVYSLPMHQLLNEKLAEFSIILDSFFTGVVNTTSTRPPWGVTKWQAKSKSTLNRAKWCTLVPILTHKAAKTMAKLTSQLCDNLQLAACLSGRWSHLKSTQTLAGNCLTSLRSKPLQSS